MKAINKWSVDLVSITPNAEKLMEYCCRKCYNSIDKITDMSYITFLQSAMKRGHFSILSFAHAVFEIYDISRACSHQVVRHAHLRYLQQSQRFVDQSSANYVLPPSIQAKAQQEVTNNPDIDSTAFDIFEDICWDGEDAYKQLIHRGIKKEDARYVLPNAGVTTIVVSGTLQGWFDYLRLRMSKHAQWEIRGVSQDIYKILNKEVPSVFNKEILVVQPPLNLEFPE